MVALPPAMLRAGDDNPPVHPASPSPVAQMDDYLHGQHVVHAIETAGGDFKGDGGAETLIVRIYGVAGETRQTALCTALGATVKKSRVHTATVLFFMSGPDGAVQRVVFQPSMLPGGNASVEFPRDPSPVSYHLQRTVKL